MPLREFLPAILICSESEIQCYEFRLLVQPISLNIDMKMIRFFKILRFNVQFLQVFSGLFGKYSTRTQSVLHQFQIILCKNQFVEISPLDLLIFDLLLQDTLFFPSIRLKLVLLPLTTLLPDHEPAMISSMTEVHLQSFSHSESRPACVPTSG